MKIGREVKDIYIVDVARTPIGRTFKGLKEFTAADLAAITIDGILDRNTSVKNHINQIILGNTVSSGTGQNLARHAVSLSCLDIKTPAFLVNSVCGSGLQSIIMAAQAMVCDNVSYIIAGGVESASYCPQIFKRDKEPIDSLVLDGLWCGMSDQHMGELAEQLAEKFKISRQAQDIFAFESHQKALKAQAEGKFDKEILSVKKKDGSLLVQDERPRKNINLEKMGKLPSAFKENGTITAGNSSVPGDAAAAVLLATDCVVKNDQLKPKARVLGYASIALDPKDSFEGAMIAVETCLKNSGLEIQDIDLFEVGESFASQAILTQQKLRIPDEKMNIFGGDIALGHPLGSTAARMLVTLICALEDRKKKIGLVTVCFGGGGAVAMAVERL